MNKKFLIAFSLTFLGLTNVFSQTVNDIPIKDIDVDYIQIVGTAKLVGNKVSIEIDFGQENSYWTTKDTKVKDKNGKVMKFNSMIDALNYLSKNGYEFTSAYAIRNGTSNVYHYLLKKIQPDNKEMI